jgi:uncharacterized protein (DUF2141 family)
MGAMTMSKFASSITFLLLSAATLLFAPALAQSPPANGNAPINIVISGFPDNVGRASCALYNQAKGWATDKNVFMSATAQISGSTATCTFNNVPSGTYAVAFFHDRNMNNKMPKNFIGIPQAGYGFSNNVKPRGFGPPSFADASFSHDGSQATTVNVKLQQWTSAL